MEIIKEVSNYWELKDNSWSGALDTLADIERANKEDELMDFLEEVFADRTPTETEVNDLLWHDRSYVYENVGLDSDGELPVDFDSDGAGVTQKYLDYVSDEFWSECPTRLCFNMEEVTKEVINGTDYTKVVLSLDGEGLKEEVLKEEYDKEKKTLWSRFQAKGNTITIIVLDRITRDDLDDIGDFLNEIQDKFEED
jgi:hypothetical protein